MHSLSMPGCMQAYVIATSTLVEISKVDVSKFDDAYFKSSDKAQKKKGEDAFFEEKSEKKELNADYIDNQKKVSHKLWPSWQAGTCIQAVAHAPCLFVGLRATSSMNNRYFDAPWFCGLQLYLLVHASSTKGLPNTISCPLHRLISTDGPQKLLTALRNVCQPNEVQIHGRCWHTLRNAVRHPPNHTPAVLHLSRMGTCHLIICVT